MGLVHAEIELINTMDIGLADNGVIKPEEIKKGKYRLCVDSGAYMLCINEEIKTQLGIRSLGFESVRLANGKIEKYEMVGPVSVKFENRNTICRALVLPGNSEPLLGAIPMEDMDVVINPKLQRMTINPEHPYMAQTILR